MYTTSLFPLELPTQLSFQRGTLEYINHAERTLQTSIAKIMRPIVRQLDRIFTLHVDDQIYARLFPFEREANWHHTGQQRQRIFFFANEKIIFAILLAEINFSFKPACIGTAILLLSPSSYDRCFSCLISLSLSLSLLLIRSYTHLC